MLFLSLCPIYYTQRYTALHAGEDHAGNGAVGMLPNAI